MKIEHLVLGEIETNTYFIAAQSGRCAIVDPAAEPEAIGRFLEARGYTPAFLLITHCHHDHIGAVKQLAERYGAKIVMSKEDYETLTNPDRFNARYANHVAGKQFTPDIFVENGDAIGLDELSFCVVATPGHTAGGVCYVCGDSIFAGDTLFAGTVGRCDLYGGSFPSILESVKRLAAMPGDYAVYPGHGAFTTLAAERAGNPYINGTYIEMDDY